MEGNLIRTEEQLIAALSSPGRYMEFIIWEDDEGSYEAYVIRQFPAEKILYETNFEFARQWADQHDMNDPLYGPYCSTWSLPEFRPDISAKGIEAIDAKADLASALSIEDRRLEREWFMDHADDPDAWMWVIRQGDETVALVSEAVGNKWASEHGHTDPLFDRYHPSQTAEEGKKGAER